MIHGTRSHVRRIYKELLYMGRDWPGGYRLFRDKLHRAFMSQRNIRSEVEIWRRIERAEYVKKGRVSRSLNDLIRDEYANIIRTRSLILPQKI